MKLLMTFVRLRHFGTLRKGCIYREQDSCLEGLNYYLPCRESSSAALQSLLRVRAFLAAPSSDSPTLVIIPHS
jgi:hypothetical protein